MESWLVSCSSCHNTLHHGEMKFDDAFNYQNTNPTCIERKCVMLNSPTFRLIMHTCPILDWNRVAQVQENCKAYLSLSFRGKEELEWDDKQGNERLTLTRSMAAILLKRHLHINLLRTHPLHRGQGLATKLLNKIKAWAKSTIVLQCSAHEYVFRNELSDNHMNQSELRKFYLGFGFKPISQLYYYI